MLAADRAISQTNRTFLPAPEDERNPFLGLRSIRLALRNLPLFRTQLRAALRASTLGDVRVMFPLISTLLELRQAKMVLADVMEDLDERGVEFNRDMAIGIMVEVPATVMMIDNFAEEVDFNRDIRPILADKCYFCHGPDAKNQKSEFRLDTEENALKDLGGYFGIVPGNLKESETHWRIRLDNSDDDVMPPVDSNRSLTKKEKDLLDAWIFQGAKYDLHWSFQIPKRLDLPKSSEANVARAKIAPAKRLCMSDMP